MVDTVTLNGDAPPAPPALQAPLPDVVHLNADEAQRIPAPGTQRALKAETGRSWDELVGPDADSADRFQTMIWVHLRRKIPGLRWNDCADVDVEIHELPVPADPTKLDASETSPHSVGSGV